MHDKALWNVLEYTCMNYGDMIEIVVKCSTEMFNGSINHNGYSRMHNNELQRYDQDFSGMCYRNI